MLRTTGIGLNLLYNYFTAEVPVTDNEPGGDALIKRASVMAVLAQTLKSYGGLLAKVAQMFSLGDPNNDTFSDNKPYNLDSTVKFLKQHSYMYESHLQINYTVFKAGSVGAVFKALKLDSNETVIMKIQYVDLKQDIEADFKSLERLSSILFSFADARDAMKDIRSKLDDELDYVLEMKNHERIRHLWKDDKHICIPKIYPPYCTDKVLVMEYVEAETLPDFLRDATQDERNFIGTQITRFVFTTLVKHRILYSDIHYGNFLVQRVGTGLKLIVLDHGCIHEIDDQIHAGIMKLYRGVRTNDMTMFNQAVTQLRLADETKITKESRAYLFTYIKLQMEPWLQADKPFVYTIDYAERSKYKQTELMADWIIPQNLVYFYKIPYAFTFLLQGMTMTPYWLTELQG